MFCLKQKTAYEMRISGWSSDVCTSDLTPTFYGAQSYDAINLIASAVAATKGNLKDKAAVQKALEAAKNDSVRGPFKFNTNHFPIEAIYQQEIGRAPCRGRVWPYVYISVVAGYLKKTRTHRTTKI